jgi:hypothetical protein
MTMVPSVLGQAAVGPAHGSREGKAAERGGGGGGSLNVDAFYGKKLSPRRALSQEKVWPSGVGVQGEGQATSRRTRCLSLSLSLSLSHTHTHTHTNHHHPSCTNQARSNKANPEDGGGASNMGVGVNGGGGSGGSRPTSARSLRVGSEEAHRYVFMFFPPQPSASD